MSTLSISTCGVEGRGSGVWQGLRGWASWCVGEPKLLLRPLLCSSLNHFLPFIYFQKRYWEPRHYGSLKGYHIHYLSRSKAKGVNGTRENFPVCCFFPASKDYWFICVRAGARSYLHFPWNISFRDFNLTFSYSPSSLLLLGKLAY